MPDNGLKKCLNRIGKYPLLAARNAKLYRRLANGVQYQKNCHSIEMPAVVVKLRRAGLSGISISRQWARDLLEQIAAARLSQ